MENFDPSGVGIANGNIFGFPVEEIDAEIILIPVPWDVTASYGKGTSRGPEQILKASTQLDFFHPKLKDAHKTPVFMLPISREAIKMNDELVLKAMEYIDFLETGGKIKETTQFQGLLEKVNEAQKAIQKQIKERSLALIKKGKTVGIVGGEHSVPLGLLEALNQHYKDGFAVLQLDAHADLREAYEGFEQSHASIFYNALKFDTILKLVQVGIRDIAPVEVDFIIKNKNRITTFYDHTIKEQLFEGKTWRGIVDEIIKELPENVYLSYDIDVLHPSLCPNTGTPVPGGFQLNEINFLLEKLVDAGKKIIGFDVCEVSNGNNRDWDANVGARALWEVVVACERSR